MPFNFTTPNVVLLRRATIAAALFCIAVLLTACLHQANRWTGSPGILLDPTPDGIQIYRIVPQQQRGTGTLQEGDMLIAVNGTPVANLSISEVHQLLRGPVGGTVDVAIQRGDTWLALRLERIMLENPQRRTLWVTALPSPDPAAFAPQIDAPADTDNAEADNADTDNADTNSDDTDSDDTDSDDTDSDAGEDTDTAS
ncbi:MAG: PDZ domain-containing protein [Myxococcales bacterium]|jgi:hypothetical protein|nr:PDZ domain-containing protein [Myxococcales bacterium]